MNFARRVRHIHRSRDGHRTPVERCARCKGTHTITWRKLQNPVHDSDGIPWTHWAPCPTTGEPILMSRQPLHLPIETTVTAHIDVSAEHCA